MSCEFSLFPFLFHSHSLFKVMLHLANRQMCFCLSSAPPLRHDDAQVYYTSFTLDFCCFSAVDMESRLHTIQQHLKGTGGLAKNTEKVLRDC